jgi:hypothetical protein
MHGGASRSSRKSDSSAPRRRFRAAGASSSATTYDYFAGKTTVTITAIRHGRQLDPEDPTPIEDE